MHLESQVQRGCAGSLSSLYVHFSNLPAQPRLADLTERLYHTRSCVCDVNEVTLGKSQGNLRTGAGCQETYPWDLRSFSITSHQHHLRKQERS